MNNQNTLDISWATIFKISIALLCFYFLFLIKDIIVWIIFALIISILLNPVIKLFRKVYIPRIISTILVYMVIFGTLSLIIYWITPFIISEVQQFSQAFPQYFDKISPSLKGLDIELFKDFETFDRTLEKWLIDSSTNIFSGLLAIFGGFFSTITIFTIALFLSLEERGVEKAIALLSPKKYEVYVLDIWERVQKKVSGWFAARILSCIFVGILAFMACYILDVKYAVSFGVLAGILEIVPIVGPIITGIIVVIFTAFDSWLKALFILIAFFLIQQIEGNILTPILTKKLIGLPSVLVLIALVAGGKLGGFLGAILAIPLTGILFEFSRDFLKKRKEESTVVL